jgi:hypothetical protein
MGVATSCSWEKYHLVGEHMCFRNLFLNTFIKTVHFLEIFAGWMRIMDAWMPDNREFTVIITFYSAVWSCVGQRHKEKLCSHMHNALLSFHDT